MDNEILILRNALVWGRTLKAMSARVNIDRDLLRLIQKTFVEHISTIHTRGIVPVGQNVKVEQVKFPHPPELTVRQRKWSGRHLIQVAHFLKSLKSGCILQLTTCNLEKEMAAHSSTIAWKIPWTEEPGRLQSMGSQRVGYNWATPLSTFLYLSKTYMIML